MFGGSSQKSPAASGLSAQWQQYSRASTSDVEAGASDTAPLFGSVEATTSAVGGAFRSAYNQISSAVPTSASISNIQMPTMGLPSQQQFGLALLMVCGGCLFLLLAFAVFLPVLIVAPAKFAISFTLGCALVMAGVSCLRGWQQQLGHMFSKERLPFTAAYLASVLSTLYSALILKSYVFSLLSSAFQVMALAYYLVSYIPGGSSSLQFGLTMAANGIKNMFAR